MKGLITEQYTIKGLRLTPKQSSDLRFMLSRLAKGVKGKLRKLQSPTNTQPASNIHAFTEYQIKRKFIEMVNDHIFFYNNASMGGHRKYHENAIAAHATTAYALGWEDLALQIQIQASRLMNGGVPTPISKRGS